MKSVLSFVRRFPKSILFTLGLIVVGLLWVFTDSLVLKVFIPIIWYGAIIMLHKAKGFQDEE